MTAKEHHAGGVDFGFDSLLACCYSIFVCQKMIRKASYWYGHTAHHAHFRSKPIPLLPVNVFEAGLL